MIGQPHSHSARRGFGGLPVLARGLPFQVQIRDADSDSWRVYAQCSSLGEAEACLQELCRRGLDARLSGCPGTQSIRV